MRRFDCTSDGSYVEIVHVSLADEAALTGDEDDEAYEGPVRCVTRHVPASADRVVVQACVVCPQICIVCSSESYGTDELLEQDTACTAVQEVP